jgi:hypothetical protein
MGKLVKVEGQFPFFNGLDPGLGGINPIMTAQTGERACINHSIKRA